MLLSQAVLKGWQLSEKKGRDFYVCVMKDKRKNNGV